MTLTVGQPAIHGQRSACQRSCFRRLLTITLMADDRFFPAARF